jgi:hypothetical protein
MIRNIYFANDDHGLIDFVVVKGSGSGRLFTVSTPFRGQVISWLTFEYLAHLCADEDRWHKIISNSTSSRLPAIAEALYYVRSTATILESIFFNTSYSFHVRIAWPPTFHRPCVDVDFENWSKSEEPSRSLFIHLILRWIGFQSLEEAFRYAYNSSETVYLC